MGGYRVKKPKKAILWHDPDKDLVNSILEIWCRVGLIQPMGKYDRFYYRILCDNLPQHESLQESLFIEWYFGPKPNDVPMPAEVFATAIKYRKTLQLFYKM
jgi:hypothetical protein